MRKITILFVFVFVSYSLSAQQVKRVLFVGNSYTYVNDLPGMIADMAASVGNNLQHTSSTPGGCTFMQHCNNQSMTLIQQGGWDAVILQEQSQYPSFPQWQVEAEVFPYATQLVNAIYAASPCAEPMFYMTWGRRDGDQMNADEFPVLGTYEGMDSMLCLRYTQMAADNDAALCPVGRVWHLLRTEHPEIELYASDGSHPSLAGTYAASCAFYAMLFNHNPTELTFNGGLSEDVARIIRLAASQTVWSEETSLPQSQWTRPLPRAEFQVIEECAQQFNSSTTQLFYNLSTHADSLLWSFGDETTLSTAGNIDSVFHTYTDTGDYTISLVASRHCMTDTAAIAIHISHIDSTGAIDTTIVDPVGIINPSNKQLNSLTNKRFNISPTITKGIISVVLSDRPSSSACIDATILSPNGRTLIHKRLCDSHQLDLSQLPSGLYLIKLQIDNYTDIHKVVKK